MIFIYGIKAKTIATEPLAHVVCKHCGEPHAMYGSIQSRHIHLFWIPLFPIGKKGYTVCTHCKQTMDEQKMPANYKEAVYFLKVRSKIPLWQFSGLIAIGVAALIPTIISIIAVVAIK